MSVGEWAMWGALLFLQQFTFLFSGRAKSSGSLAYSFITGLGSHSTWFFSNLYFVRSIIEFRDASWPVKFGVCAFYVVFCQAGTQIALRIAYRIERGKMRVGA
jgi:hypothetical protein